MYNIIVFIPGCKDYGWKKLKMRKNPIENQVLVELVENFVKLE